MDTKQQTAVEWLFQQLWNTPKDKLDWYAILAQAKQMEREQIIDAAGGVHYTQTYESTGDHKAL